MLLVVVLSAVLAVGAAAPKDATISSIKCREYASYVGECRAGQPSAMIHTPGKRPANGREFPHMAHVGFTDQDGEVLYMCGGTLISPNFVLTAAHCIKEQKPPEWVLLGELDHSTDKDDARPVKISVAERIAHPDHTPKTMYNDIALLRLQRPANLSQYVRPACLHTGPPLAPGQRAVATGWGVVDFGGEPSDILMKVDLPVVDGGDCSKAYSEVNRRLPDGIRTASQLCAGGGRGEDTCQGDAGGPLQVLAAEPPCMYSVVGVTSFGKACGLGDPGVYTRVSNFVPWIESVVWP